MGTTVPENKEPSSCGCQPERSEKKQAKGAGGPACPVSAPYKGADGSREAENVSHRRTGNKGVVRANAVVPTCGESLLARTQTSWFHCKLLQIAI